LVSENLPPYAGLAQALGGDQGWTPRNRSRLARHG